MCRCGQVHITHGYEFVVDSKQLVWTESQFSEKLTFQEKTFLGLNKTTRTTMVMTRGVKHQDGEMWGVFSYRRMCF